MNARYRGLAALLCMALALGGLCAGARAESSGGYAVRGVLPENQWNDQVTYFDLQVEPGQQQVLQVVILNRADEEIEVAVEANTAFSNANGVIEFEPGAERDESLAVDFSQVVQPVEPIVKVPANGEAIAEFNVNVPDEPFEGAVYGGFSFFKLHQGEDDEVGAEGGMAIRNVFRYVIGARLRESDAVIEPEFELQGAEMAQGGMPAVVLHLRNPRPLVVKNLAVRAKVYPGEGGGEPIALERSGADMAPNSTMPYTVYLPDGATIDPGEHRVEVELTLGERTWQFEATLTAP